MRKPIAIRNNLVGTGTIQSFGRRKRCTRCVIRSHEGKVVVITGAARGLGTAWAGEVAARKSHLALIDINSRGVERSAQELSRDGTVVTYHVADVASQQDLERVATEVRSAHVQFIS